MTRIAEALMAPYKVLRIECEGIVDQLYEEVHNVLRWESFFPYDAHPKQKTVAIVVGWYTWI